jgi:hypothetical protein
MTIWNILWPFGIICSHMVYFSHFGMFGPRKIWQSREALLSALGSRGAILMLKTAKKISAQFIFFFSVLFC